MKNEKTKMGVEMQKLPYTLVNKTPRAINGLDNFNSLSPKGD